MLERAPEGGAQTFQAQEKAGDPPGTGSRRRARPGGGPLVVYLSTLGAVANGKVHLIPGDARPTTSTSWLPLDEVLSRLRRASVPRLLMLDVRPAVDPRIALTGEDVNERLDAALAGLAEAGELPFLVLTANTPRRRGERPPRAQADRLRAGAWPGAGARPTAGTPTARDGRVSARELAAYARELTHYISTTAGLPAQTPRLHGTGGDFDIFAIPQSACRAVAVAG